MGETGQCRKGGMGAVWEDPIPKCPEVLKMLYELFPSFANSAMLALEGLIK